MMRAIIFSIPTDTVNGYSWRWRSADSTVESKEQFAFYYECVADARANGYSVESPETSPR